LSPGAHCLPYVTAKGRKEIRSLTVTPTCFYTEQRASTFSHRNLSTCPTRVHPCMGHPCGLSRFLCSQASVRFSNRNLDFTKCSARRGFFLSDCAAAEVPRTKRWEPISGDMLSLFLVLEPRAWKLPMSIILAGGDPVTPCGRGLLSDP